MTTTTPKRISEKVLEFCRSIRFEAKPEFVPVRVDPGAKYGSCYFNIQSKIRGKGGQMLWGWTIWEEPGFFLEAEHHAVWVSPDDEWVDITPHEEENTILFLPDPQRVWKRKPIPSQRFALKDDERLHELLGLSDQRDQLRIKYARKDGTPVIPASAVRPLQERVFQLIEELGIPFELPTHNMRRQNGSACAK